MCHLIILLLFPDYFIKTHLFRISSNNLKDPKDPNAHLAHLVAHASLDLIDEVSASSSNPYAGSP